MNNNKSMRRKRSVCSWKRNNIRTESIDSPPSRIIEYPPGPIQITPSWNPLNRLEKPPYSYATIIGHAILTSAERKLTLHDIYIWITENYPFYTNDSQGWQNSIRHNLSLHKSFVKIDRDSNANTPPRKGCYWTIKPGKEQFFIDNLQKPLSSVRRQQQSMAQLPSANNGRRRQASISHRASCIAASAATNGKLLNGHHHQHQRQYLPTFSSPNSIAALSPLNTITDTCSRTTTTDFPSTTAAPADDASSSTLTAAPESELHISLPSAPSSSDHLSSYSSYSSSSSSPLSNSPAYQQLLCYVSETTSLSYSVYPEHHTELFGDQHNDLLYRNACTDKDFNPPPSAAPVKSYYYNSVPSKPYCASDNRVYSNGSPSSSVSPYDSFSATSSVSESHIMQYPCHHQRGTVINSSSNSSSRSPDLHSSYHFGRRRSSSIPSVRPTGDLLPHSTTTLLQGYDRKMLLPYTAAMLTSGRSPSYDSKTSYFNNGMRSPFSSGYFQQDHQAPFFMDNSTSMYGTIHR